MRQKLIVAGTAMAALAMYPAMAERETTIVKILLPLQAEAISEVRLGDRRCRILSKSGSADVMSILVHNPSFNMPGKDEEQDSYGEVEAFLKTLNLKESLRLEVWSSSGTGRYEISAPFGSYRVSAMRNWEGPLNFPGKELTDDRAEIIRLVSRRFANKGPVRMFLVGSYFSVDARNGESAYSGAFNTTRIEPFWDHVGDSGIVVYPVIIPDRKNRPPQPIQKKTFSSQLFGTSELQAGGEYGAALKEVYRRAQQEVVVEIEVPRQYYTAFRRAPKLQVFSADGVKRFERPFIAGGEPVDETAARAEMERSLSRVVRPLAVQSAGLKRSCPGIESSGPGSLFLHLKDADFAASQPASGTVWVTSQAPGVLIEREAKATLIRDGRNGCLGPLPSVSGRTLFVYDPGQMWLATVEIQSAK